MLINVSRGPLIDEVSLADALDAGTIAGAGLDVLAIEPPPPTSRLLQSSRTVITPHVAWYSRSSERRVRVEAVRRGARLSRGATAARCGVRGPARSRPGLSERCPV